VVSGLWTNVPGPGKLALILETWRAIGMPGGGEHLRETWAKTGTKRNWKTWKGTDFDRSYNAREFQF
jgi:hypothetical protein